MKQKEDRGLILLLDCIHYVWQEEHTHEHATIWLHEQDQYNEIPVHAGVDRRLLHGPTPDEEPQEVNACCEKEAQLLLGAGPHIDSPNSVGKAPDICADEQT